MKKEIISLFCSAVMAMSALAPLKASADEPYDVYNYDRWGEAVPAQAGYIADRTVSGYDLGIGAFDSPSDIFCDSEQNFYLADTKNDRIVVIDTKLENVLKIYDSFRREDGTDTSLHQPKGVFVSAESGYIYVADSESDRVIVADKDGNIILEIGKPDSDLFNAPTFKPQRVLADKAGNIYVVLGNITTGAAMFAPDGSFMGFYGANRVEPTSEIIRNYFRNLFASDEKRARRVRNVPTGITSFDIDGDFIYTCTASATQTTDTVKKLNAAGKNIFANLELSFGDHVPMYDTAQNKVLQSSIIDIDVSDNGNINILDLTAGRIFQYDEDCNLLFIVGSLASQVGGFKQVSALESNGSELYVVDAQKDTITVFKETSFGKIVHEATEKFNAGYYEEALEPWYEVLKRDGNYRRAYIGVALALLRKGDYKGSMKYAKLADAPSIYNKAFEGYRAEFLKKNFGKIFAGLAAVIIIFAVLRKYKAKRRISAANAADNENEKRKEE